MDYITAVSTVEHCCTVTDDSLVAVSDVILTMTACACIVSQLTMSSVLYISCYSNCEADVFDCR